MTKDEIIEDSQEIAQRALDVLDIATTALAECLDKLDKKAEELTKLQEAAKNLCTALTCLPVEQLIERDPVDGSPIALLGYAMQAQGEWQDVLNALTVLEQQL